MKGSAMTVFPYRTRIADDMLDDLRDRLARTRWADEVEGGVVEK